ncbi:hypothetical protein sscle_04g039520 [Sclerotinia sclerotiorum 1980 UF-70]|uniref:Uncharacterized protein n=2 Tax=Sclerotinia sclerotiorum (strain ATCC 18683 / 1980 / Ss-1) TaxID=665079 RepID=A0A1D9Q2X6_SCLS1|nr:hypothetical protein sscle_04g039520 [Sclerotinia sclerotiorum 1980 UF-70]
MGRLESLTAWALGRTPYEDQVIWPTPPDIFENSGYIQIYDEHGHPRNPETKRRERENIRAANEVMQVTGIVEDLTAVRAAAKLHNTQKIDETIRGLRILEAGRATLHAGVWGVIAFRRRVLLYRSYSDVGILALIQHERATRSVTNLCFSGLHTVIAYHISDWVGCFLEVVLDQMFDENERKLTPQEVWIKYIADKLVYISFRYITLHLRMFAMFYQFGLVKSSQILPPLMSLIPFSKTSMLHAQPPPSANIISILSWSLALVRSTTPIVAVLFHGKIKYIMSRLLYRPIYKSLPRPTGESMFAGLGVEAPILEFDTPDDAELNGPVRGGEEDTLRALEGLPPLERTESRSRRHTNASMSVDEDEDARPTLISFDVDSTSTPAEPTFGLGTWSAELRSASDPNQSKDIKYRKTGLTMLPTILAAEGFRELAASILITPLEALMIRFIGRAYGNRVGIDLADFYEIGFQMPSLKHLVASWAFQFIATGLVWSGFTLAIEYIANRKKKIAQGKPAALESDSD